MQLFFKTSKVANNSPQSGILTSICFENGILFRHFIANLTFSADLNKIFQFLELFAYKLTVSRYNSDKPLFVFK